MENTVDTPVPDRSRRCAIAVMAKLPCAGRTKTRLCPFLSPEEAKNLGGCFLKDMTTNLALASREVPLDAYVAFTPAGSESAFASIVEAGTGFVLADGDASAPAGVQGFGRCLLQAARSLFAIGYGAVGLLNSDSPTLPTSALVRAVRYLLDAGDKTVLGASTDGGYYLLGMKEPHAGLFRAVDWSTERVASQTRRRCDEIGLNVVELDVWYDVDDPGSLARLIAEIEDLGSLDPPPFPAPATAAWLRQNRIRQRFADAGESCADTVRLRRAAARAAAVDGATGSPEPPIGFPLARE